MNALSVQSDMDQNIKFIIKQLGLLGFFEALLEKPEQNDGESKDAYKARLEKLLVDTKTAVQEGMGEGVMVGYKEDHEFTFNSTTKDLRGVQALYEHNEIQIANGLKISPQFIGVGQGGGQTGTETGLSIIFTKMLSQLTNIQKLIAANLKFGYSLELKLAGFKFQNLRVEFGPSTIADDLKFQQAQEIKIRNVDNKYNMGVISQQQKADELGYDKPDQKEPRAPIDDSGKEKQDREKDKDASDRKVRDKNKPQPKQKAQKANAAEQIVDLILDYITLAKNE